MTSTLVACPTCARHVRASEPTCVFCGATLGAASTSPPQLATARLGRAAMIALGLSVLAFPTPGCSSSTGVTLTPPYGTPPCEPASGCVELGGACSGKVYVDGGSDEYLYCDDGVWVFTTTDPASDGYTLDSSESAEYGDTSDDSSYESSSEESTDESSEETTEESSATDESTTDDSESGTTDESDESSSAH